MAVALAVILAFISYLVGAVPFAYVLGRGKGVDIRSLGSGNVGATNVGRILGRPFGFLTFFLDFGKGALPVLGSGLLWHRLGWEWPSTRGVVAICGGSAIAGHIWSVFLGFRGGKGVATSMGVAGLLSWQALGIGLAAWLFGAYLLRYVFVGSILFALSLPISFVVIERDRAWMEEAPVTILFSAIAVIVAIRHGSNFRRLMAGTEERTGQKVRRAG